MERIKQALDKAREDRSRTGHSFGPHPPASPVTAIRYSHTQTQPLHTRLLREQRIMIDQDAKTSVTANAYGILRTQILQRLSDQGGNALAITSPGPQEGKTLTAINLAISLAQEVTYTVLLVDANLRQPSLHTYFGLTPEKGLSDYLTGDLPLSELLIHPAGIDRLVLLPGGTPLDNSSAMLNSPKMKHLVDELKERYRSRIILFDLPCLLFSADALAFSPYIDAALLVLEDGKNTTDDIRSATELLQHTHLIGTVLNKSRHAHRHAHPPKAETSPHSASPTPLRQRIWLGLRGWVRRVGKG